MNGMQALLKLLPTDEAADAEAAITMKLRQSIGTMGDALLSGDESPTALLVSLQKMRVMQITGEVQPKVGVLHSAPNYQMPTSLNVSEMVLKVISDNGLNGCDLSANLNPNMTTLDVAKWKVKLYKAVHKNPNTIYFVTCDCVTSIEAILHMDNELKLSAMAGFVKYQGDAQGLAWRGEDYVRIAGLHGFSQPMHALTQVMKALTEPDQECVICMEVIKTVYGKTVDSIVTGRSQFTCMHSICRKCYEKEKMESCPVCRCEESLNAAMKKTLSKAPTGKGKKKMRAAARRNR